MNKETKTLKCSDCHTEIKTRKEEIIFEGKIYEVNGGNGTYYGLTHRCDDCFQKKGFEGIIVKNPKALSELREELKKVVKDNDK